MTAKPIAPRAEWLGEGPVGEMSGSIQTESSVFPSMTGR